MSRAVYIYNHACGRCGGGPAAGAAGAPPDDPHDAAGVVLYPTTSARALPLFGAPASVDPALRAVVEEQRAAYADVDLTAVSQRGG